MLIPLESSFLDTLGGLPVHPLVVHAAVVLLPLSALLVLVALMVRPWRRRLTATWGDQLAAPASGASATPSPTPSR